MSAGNNSQFRLPSALALITPQTQS